MDQTPNRQNMGGLFDNFFSSSNLRSDVYESDNNFYVEMDIPGISKDDISLDCQNGYLTVGIARKEATTDEGRNYYRRERLYAEQNRQFYVGNVDSENIKAEYKEGILKVIVPRAEQVSNKKTIPIE